tara:strand:- start:1712 stop:2200 length:489 start_codon:yes stop_codon:yes gene_type:complete
MDNNLLDIAVFVDVQNIYYTTKQAFKKSFDYRKFWRHLEAQGNIKCAKAYAIDRGDAKQLQFQDTLRKIGFDVQLKPFIQRSDGSAKGDWDVGITIDVMRIAPTVDKVILLSGDGDFDLLMRYVMETQGIKTEAYGVEELSAKSLITSVSTFRPIDESMLIH